VPSAMLRAYHQAVARPRAAISPSGELPLMHLTTAARPFGAYDRQVLKALRRYGYTKMFTSNRRHAQADAWLQPRYAVKREDTLQSVRSNILAQQPMHDRVRRTVVAPAQSMAVRPRSSALSYVCCSDVHAREIRR
jgi:hypothetical protein